MTVVETLVLEASGRAHCKSAARRCLIGASNFKAFMFVGLRLCLFLEYWQILRSRERSGWRGLSHWGGRFADFGVSGVCRGGISPADSFLDLLVAFVLTRLLGCGNLGVPRLLLRRIIRASTCFRHGSAVWFVTRQQVKSSEPEILPPGPAPSREHSFGAH